MHESFVESESWCWEGGSGPRYFKFDRRFAALAWSKKEKYCWSCCCACDEMALAAAVPLEVLMVDDNDVRDDEGVS